MSGDAFRDRMAEATRSGRPDLGHQSLGRPLTGREDALADALMAVYAAGISDPDAVAAALAARGVPPPLGGVWTAAALEAELAAINERLDAVYRDNGTGA